MPRPQTRRAPAGLNMIRRKPRTGLAMSIVLLLALFAVLIYYGVKLAKKRAAAFAAAADGMGFTYSPNGSPFAGTDVDGISLLTDTAQHVYRNVLVSKDGSRVVISQFIYRVLRAGKGSVRSDGRFADHSLVAYRLAKDSLPRFCLYTRGVFGNIGIPLDATAFRGMFTEAGIDPGSEAFSKRYVLVAENASAARRVFDPFVVKALTDQPPHSWLHIQVSPDWLVFYDPSIRILGPADVGPALARIQPVADRILEHAEQATAAL
jgi:hypothetical protein